MAYDNVAQVMKDCPTELFHIRFDTELRNFATNILNTVSPPMLFLILYYKALGYASGVWHAWVLSQVLTFDPNPPHRLIVKTGLSDDGSGVVSAVPMPHGYCPDLTNSCLNDLANGGNFNLDINDIETSVDAALREGHDLPTMYAELVEYVLKASGMAERLGYYYVGQQHHAGANILDPVDHMVCVRKLGWSDTEAGYLDGQTGGPPPSRQSIPGKSTNGVAGQLLDDQYAAEREGTPALKERFQANLRGAHEHITRIESPGENGRMIEPDADLQLPSNVPHVLAAQDQPEAELTYLNDPPLRASSPGETRSQMPSENGSAALPRRASLSSSGSQVLAGSPMPSENEENGSQSGTDKASPVRMLGDASTNLPSRSSLGSGVLAGSERYSDPGAPTAGGGKKKNVASAEKGATKKKKVGKEDKQPKQKKQPSSS